jgi:hypothetical protein
MDVLASFNEISLEDLSIQAELLRRFDTKFIVPLEALPQIYAALPPSTHVLAIEGQRHTSYVTHYYDSADLHTYYDHLKRRRKRFKIRTRFYNEPANGFLEIKIKMPRGQTQKVRWPLDVQTVLNPIGHEHMGLLNLALSEATYRPLHHSYRQTLETTFSRTTLFEPQSRERITIDAHLHASSGDARINLGSRHAIVEIKSAQQVGHSHRVFTHLGIRPMSVSKYCVAMTGLRPELIGSPWKSALHLLRQ